MRNQIIAVLLLLFIGSIFAEEVPTGYKRVKFSEVCFWPEEGESEWVELYNASDSAIDISGWKLTWSGGGEYVFPSFDPIVSFGVVIVNLGENTALKYGNLVEFNSGIHKDKDNLDKNKCQIILIDEGNVSVDKVTWGDRDIKWDNLNKVDLRTKNVMDEVSSEVLIGPAKFSKKGGSISLIKTLTYKYDAAWVVNYVSEKNKGLLSLDGKNLAPIGFGGMEKMEINLSEFKKDVYYIKVLKSDFANIKYEFQLANDSLFANPLFTPTASTSIACPVERQFLPSIKSTVYWRARYVWPDGSAGNWGEVYEIYGGDYEVSEEVIMKPRPKGI